MMKDGNDILKGCAEWQPLIPLLLDAGDDDPERKRWLEHSKDCPACAALAQEESTFKVAFQQLPDPGEANISASVMRRIRAREIDNVIFRKRDFGYGLASAVAGVIMAMLLPSEDQVATYSTASAGSTSDAVTEYVELFEQLEESSAFDLSLLTETGETE